MVKTFDSITEWFFVQLVFRQNFLRAIIFSLNKHFKLDQLINFKPLR